MDSSVAIQGQSTLAGRLADRKLVRDFGYIGGQWVADERGETHEIRNPATGASLGHVAKLGAAAATSAVDQAVRAFKAWAGLLPQDRGRLLRAWFDQISAQRENLALIMTLEQGKPLSEARAEIDYAASFIEFYAEEAKRPNIESVTSHLPGAEMEVWREPCGVAALITPWNFPSAMITQIGRAHV